MPLPVELSVVMNRSLGLIHSRLSLSLSLSLSLCCSCPVAFLSHSLSARANFSRHALFNLFHVTPLLYRFTGISGGASMCAALKVAEDAPAGSKILAMLADTGERYLSTPLFEDIEADMNGEELALSLSTPGFQLRK